MAKAKKSAKSKKDETTAPVEAAKKKEDVKTAAAKPAAPLIDTGLAAATAARRILQHKDEAPAGAPSPRGESASFKHMKENLHKPAGQATPSFLQNAVPTKKFNPSVPGRQQVGRNQTFGADVNRSGVPRRTGG
ncbi:MAG TPA: hypothetical protein VG326_03460 [Tepidisphaeraceae bacterium]|nr:hypothetical protein [Tepidisphaeraceae bacterium]